MAGISGELFLVSVSHEAKHEKSSKNSGKIRSKIRGKIQDENSKNSGNFRSAAFLTKLKKSWKNLKGTLPKGTARKLKFKQVIKIK